MSAVALGVAGGTGSGKTTVAEAILAAVGRDRIAFLAQDNYYRDVDWAGPEQIERHNFDHPDAMDTELFVEHLRTLKQGLAIELPVYDFVRHVRTGRTTRIEPRPVILVEGILLFAEPAIRELLDFKVFVDTDDDTRFIRRLQRDITERGRSVQSVIDQYLGSVKPMHLEFVEPSKRYADIIIPQGGHNVVATDMLLTLIRSLALR